MSFRRPAESVKSQEGSGVSLELSQRQDDDAIQRLEEGPSALLALVGVEAGRPHLSESILKHVPIPNDSEVNLSVQFEEPAVPR